MASCARFCVVLFVSITAATTAQAQTNTSESGSGSGNSDQSDSSDLPFPMGALIGICVGGGVVLLTVVVATCVCMVCCIWRKKRRQRTMSHYDPEAHVSHSNGHSAHSTLSHSTLSHGTSHSLTAKLLSTTSQRQKIPAITKDSDLTVGVTPTANSNPLYHSSSIPYFPQGQEHTQKETPLTEDPVLSVSPRRRSLGYVEMQSAVSALSEIVGSRSAGDFYTNSLTYASVKERGSFDIPPAPPSYTPPHSPLTNSVPASFLLKVNPSRPPPPSSHPHTLTENPVTSEEEERGGEDDYVDPKLFLEDQERIMQEEGEDTAEDYDGHLDPIVSGVDHESQLHPPLNSAHKPRPPSNSAHQPHPPAQSSYQNVSPEEAYISDSYEHVGEFLSNGHTSDDTAALLLATNQERENADISTPPHKPATSPRPAKSDGKARNDRPPKSKEGNSLDRTLSLDNQYIEVVSPSRKAHSMKHSQVQSRGDGEREARSCSPELDYQNVIPGMETSGWASGTGSVGDLRVIDRSPVVGQRSSPGKREGVSKSPSPIPRTKSPKPRPNPKPHPSKFPPVKPRSKSSDAVVHMSTQQHHLTVVSGEREQKRPHLEEIVIPSPPVANGNVVTHGNGVAVGNGGVTEDSRLRSATVPVGEGVRGEDGEEGEVLYVNLGEETGGEELYENFTHLS